MNWLIIKLSRLGHTMVNPIAWKLAPHDHGKGKDRHWLWRLNDWVARPSVDDYVYRRTGKTRKDWEKV